MREKRIKFEGRSRRNSYPKGAGILYTYLMLICPYRLSAGLCAPLRCFAGISPISQ